MNTRRTDADSPLRPPLGTDPARTLDSVALPPVLTGDTLLVARQAALEAFDERSGSLRWRLPLGGNPAIPPHPGAPLVQADRVHVCMAGELLAVDLATGSLSGRRPAPALDLHDGVFLDGCIVSHVAGTGLIAWDLARGAPRWSVQRDYDPVPLAGEGSLLLVAGAESITACDARDGRELWAAALAPGEAVGTLVIAPDGSVIAGLSRGVVSLEADTGALRWMAQVAVARPTTLAVTGDGEIHLLDLRRYMRLSALSGEVLFSKELDRRSLPAGRGSLGRLSVSLTHVFACDQRGPLVAVSRTSGAVDWIWDEARPRAAADAPVLSTQRLYALALDGTLQSFVGDRIGS